MRPSVPIMGVHFDALTFDETLTLLEGYARTPAEDTNKIIVTPNPIGVMLARRNADFARALAQADLRTADGTGIVLAARYKGTPLPERVRGLDMAFALFTRLADAPFTAYFLGGEPGSADTPGVAQRAKARMEKRFPHLRVVGTSHGFLTPDSEEEAEVMQDIREKRPDILLVCMGMPRQELWAARHRDLPVRLTLCLGGTLDVMAGNVKLAPSFWRKLGLEWLYRLVSQPGRWRRMTDIPRFAWAVIRGKA